MQLLEASPFGVRSARISLKSQSSSATVTLFPMVHIGEAAFFKDIYADAGGHDVVLVEGVDSPITIRITRSYRWVEGSRLLRGLVVQPKWTPAKARVVHADLSREEFAAVWKPIEPWLRAFIYLGAPILGLKRRWFTTRAALGKDLSLEDEPSADEQMRALPELAGFNYAIMTIRDARLVARLREQLDDPHLAGGRIAVVYGASHMRAVLHELVDRGFRPVATEWMSVFAF